MQSRLVNAITLIVIVLGTALAVLRRSRPARSVFAALSVIAAIGFALAVTLPQSLAAPGYAVGWSGLVVILAWSRLSVSVESPSDHLALYSWLAIARIIAIGGFLSLALIVPKKAAGQAHRPDEIDQPLVVFIPFDASELDKRHEATRVLLPPFTHERLIKSANSAAGLHDLVLIRSTHISGQMAHDRLELGIDLELEKLGGQQSSRVLIPLAGLIVRSAQLDDRACPVEPAAGGLYVDCDGAGRHRLHLNAVLALPGG